VRGGEAAQPFLPLDQTKKKNVAISVKAKDPNNVRDLLIAKARARARVCVWVWVCVWVCVCVCVRARARVCLPK
jgi:hypothetical protein